MSHSCITAQQRGPLKNNNRAQKVEPVKIKKKTKKKAEAQIYGHEYPCVLVCGLCPLKLTVHLRQIQRKVKKEEMCRNWEHKTKDKMGGRNREGKQSPARQIQAQLDEGRNWKGARRQERHKDIGPLQCTDKLLLSQPENTASTCANATHVKNYSRKGHMLYCMTLSYIWTAVKCQIKRKRQLIELSWCRDSEWVSVTVAGIPFCCSRPCVCRTEWNSSQGNCLPSEHWVVLQQGHTWNKILL